MPPKRRYGVISKYIGIPGTIEAGEGIPFFDDFARADGVVGNGWVSPDGAALSIASERLVVTPTRSDELFTNRGPFTFTADDPDDWVITNEGANQVITEVADGEAYADSPTPGGGYVNLYSTAAYIVMTQPVTTPATWYEATVTIDRVVAGYLQFKTRQNGNLIYRMNTTGTLTGTCCTFPTGDSIGLGKASGAADITVESVSCKTITGLKALRTFAFAEGVIGATFTRPNSLTQIGLILNYVDEDNYVFTYLGINATSSVRFVLNKWLGGNLTQFIAEGSAAYGADNLFEAERTAAGVYIVRYNGVQIISTAAIADGIYATGKMFGVFSTSATNSVNSFSYNRSVA